jgi:hypothetical protein
MLVLRLFANLVCAHAFGLSNFRVNLALACAVSGRSLFNHRCWAWVISRQAAALGLVLAGLTA